MTVSTSSSLFIALSASDPPHIEEALTESLGLKMPICIHKSLDCANIFLSTSPLKGISIRIMIFGLFIECLLCVYFNTQQDFGCLKLRVISNSHDVIPKTLNICQTKDTVVRV